MLKYVFTKFIVLCCLISFSQVPVRDEPRHHNVFENEFLRILDAYIGPGDTTQYHLHNTPSVFIVLSNANVGSRLLGGQPQKGANVSGEISYDSLARPRTHQVWNEDTSWFHVMDIELTSTRSKFNMPPLQNPDLKLLFNKEQVNGYELSVATGATVQLPPSSNGYLLVSKGLTTIDYRINDITQKRIMKAGHYIWIEAGKRSSIYSNSSTSTSFVLLQLK